MRPKKIILLIDPNETRRSITTFVLETTGHYCVIGAVSVYEAAELGRAYVLRPDLLLGFAPLSDAYLMEVAAGLKCPWLFIEPFLYRGQTIWPCMAVVLERVRITSARKRGPMKGMLRKIPPQTIETDQEAISARA